MNYLKKVSENADKVYTEVVKQKCMHGSGAKTYAEIKTKKKITCAGAVSSTLKLAGLLGDGYVNHTSAAKTNVLKKKNTVGKTVSGYTKAKHIKWIWIGKKYKDLPKGYKKAGTIYVQDSNICINAGGGYIYSCNSTGKKYTSMGMVKKKSGYPFDHPIIVVGLVDEKSLYESVFPQLSQKGYYTIGDGKDNAIDCKNIKYLQKFLNWALNIKLDPDGIYGQKTKDAVKKFQEKVGFPPNKCDGLFGKDTLAKAKTFKR